MIERRRTVLVLALALGSWTLLRCGGGGTVKPLPETPECTDSIQITVTIADTIPTFSWTPDCTIGRLLVEEGIDEYWGTEAPGQNCYHTPIVFNSNPPCTTLEEQARPLARGHTYRVTMYRWVTYTPVESLQVVGVKFFTAPLAAANP